MFKSSLLTVPVVVLAALAVGCAQNVPCGISNCASNEICEQIFGESFCIPATACETTCELTEQCLWTVECSTDSQNTTSACNPVLHCVPITTAEPQCDGGCPSGTHCEFVFPPCAPPPTGVSVEPCEPIASCVPDAQESEDTETSEFEQTESQFESSEFETELESTESEFETETSEFEQSESEFETEDTETSERETESEFEVSETEFDTEDTETSEFETEREFETSERETESEFEVSETEFETEDTETSEVETESKFETETEFETESEHETESQVETESEFETGSEQETESDFEAETTEFEQETSEAPVCDPVCRTGFKCESENNVPTCVEEDNFDPRCSDLADGLPLRLRNLFNGVPIGTNGTVIVIASQCRVIPFEDYLLPDGHETFDSVAECLDVCGHCCDPDADPNSDDNGVEHICCPTTGLWAPLVGDAYDCPGKEQGPTGNACGEIGRVFDDGAVAVGVSGTLMMLLMLMFAF